MECSAHARVEQLLVADLVGGRNLYNEGAFWAKMKENI